MLLDLAKRILLLSVALVLCPGAAVALPEDEPPAAAGTKLPRLEVESEEVDLGQVVRGEDAVGRFTFRNDGDGVLRVLKAKPG
jgi:hypothetical protein